MKRLKSMRGKERHFLDGDGTIYKILPNAPLDFFETVTLQNNTFKNRGRGYKGARKTRTHVRFQPIQRLLQRRLGG